METAKQQKNPSRGTLLSVSEVTRERHKTCSDLLFDVSIDLDEVVGTIAVMSQLGVGRNRDWWDRCEHGGIFARACGCSNVG